jgi:hypothetical protein
MVNLVIHVIEILLNYYFDFIIIITQYLAYSP